MGWASCSTHPIIFSGYLHKNNFVHRDIKPENFLMQNNQDNAEIKVAQTASVVYVAAETFWSQHLLQGVSSSMFPRKSMARYIQQLEGNRSLLTKPFCIRSHVRQQLPKMWTRKQQTNRLTNFIACIYLYFN